MDVCLQIVQNRGFQYNNFGSYEQASSRNLRTPSMYPVSNNQPQVPSIRRMSSHDCQNTKIESSISLASSALKHVDYLLSLLYLSLVISHLFSCFQPQRRDNVFHQHTTDSSSEIASHNIVSNHI
jgi:hypothetical protein